MMLAGGVELRRVRESAPAGWLARFSAVACTPDAVAPRAATKVDLMLSNASPRLWRMALTVPATPCLRTNW